MTSNSEGGGQALQILTQRFLGGHLFGVDCAFGGGQSEHVAFVMPDAGQRLDVGLTSSQHLKGTKTLWGRGILPRFAFKL